MNGARGAVAIVAHLDTEFAEAWRRWPHPKSFRGPELLDVIGFSGRWKKLYELRIKGIIEVDERLKSAGIKTWRLSPWVGEILESRGLI